ncbi:hypothetical protein ACLK1T_20430 [Escherichia coli]
MVRQVPGVVSLIRIKKWHLRKGDKVKVMRPGRPITPTVWASSRRNRLTALNETWRSRLAVCVIKDIHGAPVGDTLTLARNPAERRCLALRKLNRRYTPVCSR